MLVRALVKDFAFSPNGIDAMVTELNKEYILEDHVVAPWIASGIFIAATAPVAPAPQVLPEPQVVAEPKAAKTPVKNKMVQPDENK